jgi:hypothetical protein
MNKCRLQTIYAAMNVTQDNQLYYTLGEYGTLGMGIHSEFWKQYTDPDTNKAVYSIALEKGGQTNITFGDKNPDGDYSGSSITLKSNP